MRAPEQVHLASGETCTAAADAICMVVRALVLGGGSPMDKPHEQLTKLKVKTELGMSVTGVVGAILAALEGCMGRSY